MKSAITVCLVPEARGGPFVFHDGLAAGCRAAAELGFDAVEVFPDSAAGVDSRTLVKLLKEHDLSLAAVGTGAGFVKHKLHLIDRDPEARRKAIEFIGAIIEVAGQLGAPAIIGSMQGRVEPGADREQALSWLAEALTQLGARAERHGQPLLYEALNRYETNVFCRQDEAAAFLRERAAPNVKLLCDLFHMNIEEADLPAALHAAGDRIGHVHWADSNRRAMGFGHTDARSIVAALRALGYNGYLSAEIFPLPDSVTAARQSIDSIRTALG